MEISPVYWTLLGEITLVIIGLLGAVIIVILKDRKKSHEYINYLKKTIVKLKKKLQRSDDEQNRERVLELLKALTEYVREQYQSQYGNDIAPAEDNAAVDNEVSVEKFIFIAGFQTMIAELSALENSNEPEAAWAKIKNELTPLFQNYFESIASDTVPAEDKLSAQASENGDESYKTQLENAHQRIKNLEKFKQLYFDLQSKLSASVTEIEALNQQLSELADGSEHSDDIRQIIEKNKTHYLEMGQMIGMDKEQHHESVARSMDYSNVIVNERKDEIKRLKHKIAQQFEDIWALQNRFSTGSDELPKPEELSAGIETISRNLKDAEMCIETMDMEIQTLSSELSNLRNQLKEQKYEEGAVEQKQVLQEKDAMIARHAQEGKELMSCITGLENDNLEQSKRIHELEEKQLKMATEYSAMKAKYLKAMSQ